MVMVSPFANPGLASGGTGDVLAGIIAGLIAQGLPLDLAASCGVFIHGLAGEAVRDRIGDTGSIASDLVELLPETIHDLKLA
jgi:NAD(P)H-hydrate epimerase